MVFAMTIKRIKSPPMFSAPEPFCVTYQHAHGRICMDLRFLNCSTDIISVGPCVLVVMVVPFVGVSRADFLPTVNILWI